MEVSYYYTDADREIRKQAVLMDWDSDMIIYPINGEMILLDVDTIYQIDLDNDGMDDMIDVKTYRDTDGVYTVVINGEPTVVYEDFYYFEHPTLLQTSDGRYLVAMCYGGVNDHEKIDIYPIEDNHIRLTDSAGGGIVSYSDQVMVTGDFTEFDGFSSYEDTFILSDNGKLNQQGDSVLNHTHIAQCDFNAYLYNAGTDEYQLQPINKGTAVTLLHTDWNTVWIEFKDGMQGYFTVKDSYYMEESVDLDIWECFPSEKEVKIGFELNSYERDSIPYTDVNFIINIENEEEKLIIGSYKGEGYVLASFENQAFFNSASLVGCQVFYAGGGDNIFAYLEDGEIIVEHNEFVLGNDEFDSEIIKEEVVITKDIPKNSTVVKLDQELD